MMILALVDFQIRCHFSHKFSLVALFYCDIVSHVLYHTLSGAKQSSNSEHRKDGWLSDIPV